MLQLLYFSLHIFVWLLFEGSYYSKAATIGGWLLFKGGIYFIRKPADINDGWIRYVRAIQ